MGTKIRIPGLNIQYPWSRKLLAGVKVIETRNYPIPAHYVGRELAIIETAGSQGRKNNIETRIIGTITFSHCYKYKTKSQWKNEAHLHLVGENDSEFSYSKEKWAWVVSKIRPLPEQPPPKIRGIKFAKQCAIHV